MDYLKNHCWCSDSNWGGHYDCSIIVTLKSYDEEYEEDWKNLTYNLEVFSQTKLDRHLLSVEEIRKKYPNKYKSSSFTDKSNGNSKVNKLKPQVIQWLHDNVKDFKKEKGWCVGSDDYSIEGSSISTSVFFQKRSDAMLFIKVWSKWKKPIHYCQYFTDVRKSLNVKTGKYKII